MIAAKLTSRLASPLAGLLTDRFGPGYTLSLCLLLATPWSIVLVLRKSVALFIAALVLQSEYPDLARVLVFLNMSFRFLYLGRRSYGKCRVGGRFSWDSRPRM